MRPRLPHLSLAAAVVVALTATATLPAAVLFEDNFESGALSKWSQTNSYFIADDPLQVGDHVLSSPGGTSRTSYVRATGGIAAYTGGLSFSYQVYTGDAQSSWQAKVIFGNSAATNAPGYGFIVGATSISIRRADGGYGGWVQGTNTTTLASQTLSTPPLLTNEWNTVSFDWLENGSLTLKINDIVVLSVTDTTYAPKTGRLDLENFLNNSAGSTGRVLLFDDITLSSVTPIPEPASAAWLLGLGAAALVAARRRHVPRRS